jgi:hypothetical protein
VKRKFLLFCHVANSTSWCHFLCPGLFVVVTLFFSFCDCSSWKWRRVVRTTFRTRWLRGNSPRVAPAPNDDASSDRGGLVIVWTRSVCRSNRSSCRRRLIPVDAVAGRVFPWVRIGGGFRLQEVSAGLPRWSWPPGSSKDFMLPGCTRRLARGSPTGAGPLRMQAVFNIWNGQDDFSTRPQASLWDWGPYCKARGSYPNRCHTDTGQTPHPQP